MLYDFEKQMPETANFIMMNDENPTAELDYQLISHALIKDADSDLVADIIADNSDNITSKIKRNDFSFFQIKDFIGFSLFNYYKNDIEEYRRMIRPGFFTSIYDKYYRDNLHYERFLDSGVM